jgi:hypothetical protein
VGQGAEDLTGEWIQDLSDSDDPVPMMELLGLPVNAVTSAAARRLRTRITIAFEGAEVHLTVTTALRTTSHVLPLDDSEVALEVTQLGPGRARGRWEGAGEVLVVEMNTTLDDGEAAHSVIRRSLEDEDTLVEISEVTVGTDPGRSIRQRRTYHRR